MAMRQIYLDSNEHYRIQIALGNPILCADGLRKRGLMTIEMEQGLRQRGEVCLRDYRILQKKAVHGGRALDESAEFLEALKEDLLIDGCVALPELRNTARALLKSKFGIDTRLDYCIPCN
jgi:hypothetical protein